MQTCTMILWGLCMHYTQLYMNKYSVRQKHYSILNQSPCGNYVTVGMKKYIWVKLTQCCEPRPIPGCR
jgi:hypothetical protein